MIIIAPERQCRVLQGVQYDGEHVAHSLSISHVRIERGVCSQHLGHQRLVCLVKLVVCLSPMDVVHNYTPILEGWVSCQSSTCGTVLLVRQRLLGHEFLALCRRRSHRKDPEQERPRPLRSGSRVRRDSTLESSTTELRGSLLGQRTPCIAQCSQLTPAQRPRLGDWVHAAGAAAHVVPEVSSNPKLSIFTSAQTVTEPS